MTTKKFDANLYFENDLRAKNAFVEYLKETQDGVTIQTEPFGRYGIDIAFNVRGINYFADVEVRGNWDGGAFPFDTIHLPSRKKKFLNVCTDPTMFIAFRQDLKSFVVIPGEAVRKGRDMKLDNKYMHQEDFVEIPLTECVEVKWQG